MPSWLGGWEIIIVVVIALLVFGPKKLPELGSSLGKSITGFKKGLRDSQDDAQVPGKEDVNSGVMSATAATTDGDTASAPAADTTVNAEQTDAS